MALNNNDPSKTVASSSSKPKKTLNLNSMDAVYEAVLAGHTVYSININFSSKVAFGPKSSLKTIGGAFTSTNEGDRAFFKFMPMGYTMNDGVPKYISEGTTTVYRLIEEISQPKLAELQEKLANFNDAAKSAFLQKLVTSDNIDFEAWQAIAADNSVGGEIAFEFNSTHWDRPFIQQLGAKTASKQVKSLSVFFVLSANPNGTAKCSDICEVLKTKTGDSVYGRFFETTIVAALWNETVFYTPKYKNEVSSASFASSVSATISMQKKLSGHGTSDSMKKQVEAKNQFGNKAVANAKAAFETELEVGKWNKFVESNLNELAKSTQFPGWSILACKGYILDLQEKYQDSDLVYTNDAINIKGMAYSVKVVNTVVEESKKEEPKAKPSSRVSAV
jgi:hypothetical protein